MSGDHDFLQPDPQPEDRFEPSTPATTTSTTTDSPPVPDLDNTAALIVGGIEADTNIRLDHVELYGCQGEHVLINQETIFPTGIYLAGGTFVHDDDGGHIMLCGGFQCDPDDLACPVSSSCYEWDPIINTWRNTSAMNIPRRSHSIFYLPNEDLQDPSQKFPVAFGFEEVTEIYDEASQTWSYYKSLPDMSWTTLGCMVQANDMVYKIFDKVEVLDPNNNFTITDVADVPIAFTSPGKCATVEIDGVLGRCECKFSIALSTHSLFFQAFSFVTATGSTWTPWSGTRKLPLLMSSQPASPTTSGPSVGGPQSLAFPTAETMDSALTAR